MKKSVIFLVILLFITINVYGDNLSAVVGTGTDELLNESGAYADVATAGALDMANVDKVLVYATFTCESTASGTVKRTLTFRLHDDTPTTPLVSGVIQRFLQKEQTGDKGIGSLVYIFDVSGITSGTRAFSLEHQVDTNKGTETTATIVAIALNTDTSPYPILDNDIKSITTAVTRSVNSFAAVTGLITDPITLVTTGDLLVIASVNSQSSGGAAGGEWQLQMKQGAGGSFSGVGSSITRSLSGADDLGIITLIDVVEDQTAADYYFQVVHKATSGTIETLNTTIVAVGLGYLKEALEARRFNCDKSTLASTGTASTTAVYAATFNTAVQGTKVLLIAQYGMSATEEATSNYVVNCSGGSTTASTLQRFLEDSSDNGAGGIVGLVTGLTGSKASYDFDFQHYTDAGTLTTSNIIFGAIQLTDVFAETLPVELSAFTGQYINNVPTLYWTTQSETDNMGWFVYRNKENNFTTSEKISGFIEGHGTTTQQQSYIYEDNIQNPEVGDTYYYWLESIDYSGMVNHYDKVAVMQIPDIHNPDPHVSVPSKYGLQSGPNPFNSDLEISYMLHQTDMVRVEIYNMYGQLIAQFNEGLKTADRQYTLD